MSGRPAFGSAWIAFTRVHVSVADVGGHVTLWNGAACSDSCHLLQNPDNGTFIPDTASLWELH